MSQKILERVVVLQSDPPPIVRIHSISALQDGSIAFTDQDSRQLKIIQSGGAVKVIAGTGEESNKMALEVIPRLANQWASAPKELVYS